MQVVCDTGDACNDIGISFVDSCYKVENLGTKQIIVTMGEKSWKQKVNDLQAVDRRKPAFPR